MRRNEAEQEEVFTRLYHQNFQYVYSYLFARTAGNLQLTEDIVQETFTAAWESRSRFDQKSTYKTWLCSIAKNKLFESYRRSIRKEKFEVLEEEEFLELESGFNLEQTVLEHETRQQVLTVLNGLNPPYRYVLIMKYLEDMSVKEIAKALGKSAKAVDGLLQRSKAAFEKAYDRIEGDGGEHGR